MQNKKKDFLNLLLWLSQNQRLSGYDTAIEDTYITRTNENAKGDNETPYPFMLRRLKGNYLASMLPGM